MIQMMRLRSRELRRLFRRCMRSKPATHKRKATSAQPKQPHSATPSNGIAPRLQQGSVSKQDKTRSHPLHAIAVLLPGCPGLPVVVLSSIARSRMTRETYIFCRLMGHHLEERSLHYVLRHMILAHFGSASHSNLAVRCCEGRGLNTS